MDKLFLSCSRVHALCFDRDVCAGLNSTTSCWEGVARFDQVYEQCNIRCHIIPVTRSTVTPLVQRCNKDARPPCHSCGNHCFTSTRTLKQPENLKRLVVSLALCCCCFCFYCRGIHDGLMNRGPVSDGLQCPTVPVRTS